MVMATVFSLIVFEAYVYLMSLFQQFVSLGDQFDSNVLIVLNV